MGFYTTDLQKQGINVLFTGFCLEDLNPFLTNVSLMQKPGSCFLQAKCLKNTCGRVIF